MKQLFFLLLFPAFAMAQYPGNANQKITLGEQTTADGLVYRGVASIDTVSATSKITRTNKQDTSTYILLDTVTNLLWHYKIGSNAWTQAGGGVSVSSFSAGTTGLTPSTATTGAVTLGGTLAVANGGTGQTTLAAAGINTGSGTANYLPKYTAATTFGNSLIFDNGSNVGIGTASPTPVFQLQVTGTNSRFAMLNSSGNTANFSQILFGNGTGMGQYAEFYRQNDTKQFSIFNGNGDIFFSTNYTSNYRYDFFVESDNGNVGIGTASPTARLHLAAGTASASSAPLKFTSGTNLTTVEAGAMEFNGTNLFFSPSTTRHTVNHGLTGSATLDFPSTTTLLSADLTITVTGAADGDVVSLGVPNAAVNANTCYTAWVSSANTVTIRFNNYSSGTVNPASGTFKVFVTK